MRRKIGAAALLFAALLIGGCGGDDGADEKTAAAGATKPDCITVPKTDGSFERVKSAGTIKVGAVDGLLPYSSSDADMSGFEIDMARYVADQLCLELKPVFVSWAGLIPALQAERFDMIFDGLFITEERKKEVDFSDPYYASGETIVVRAGNPEGIAGLEDLAGKVIGVLAGSVTVDAVKHVGAKDIKVYDDQNQILLEIGNGRLDAGYLEAPSSAWVLKKQPELKAELVKEYVPEERFNAGAALRKDDADLRAAVNLAIERLVESGKRDEIFGKYGVPYFETTDAGA
jgi:ABC-type amino acid transport substrate-binding protein